MQIRVRTTASDLVDTLERTDGKIHLKPKQRESFVDSTVKSARSLHF